MKKILILISIVMISLVILASTGARIQMRNGDVIECEINMESISFITDYGEFKIPVSFVKEIVFPAPGNRVTTLNTVFPNETFGGFLLDEYISISLLGSPIRFHKDAINRINIYNDSQTITQELVQVYLKTGDQFYGEMLSTGVKIQTSYGEFNISTENIEGMEFEGEGNILTKIRLKNSSEMRGTIKDDFIVFRLLSGSELGVSPGKIKSIVFLKENTTGEPVFSQVVTIGNLQNMVLVEKGSFTMGDTRDGGNGDEKPTHKVTFTYDFHIGKYEVTFEEYDVFCEATGKSKPSDSGWGRGQRPIINVSWNDSIAYCNWLSEKEGLPVAYDDKGNFLDKNGNITTDPSMVMGYRLPTEAEWEYAARGGKNNDSFTYSGSEKADEVAWYKSNSEGKTQTVGLKKPNTLGIYDMSGNVWEWCSDYYSLYTSSAKTNPFVNADSPRRVIRGGSWDNSVMLLRVAFRNLYSNTDISGGLGFRTCRTVF